MCSVSTSGGGGEMPKLMAGCSVTQFCSSLSPSFTCERNRRRLSRPSASGCAREAIIRRLFLPPRSGTLADQRPSATAAVGQGGRSGPTAQQQRMKPIMLVRVRPPAPVVVVVRSCGPFLAFNYDIV